MPEPDDPVAEARRLLAERTPGEWAVVRYASGGARISVERNLIADVYHSADRELIAAAPRLLAALCERLEAAGALRDVRGYAAAFRDAPNHIIERATDILDWASEAQE